MASWRPRWLTWIPPRPTIPIARQDIQQALGDTLSQLALQTPTAEPTSEPRNNLVTTVPGERRSRRRSRQRGCPADLSSRRRRRRWPHHRRLPTQQRAGRLARSAGPVLAQHAGRSGRSSQPQSLFGTMWCSSATPSVQAELNVAIDNASRALPRLSSTPRPWRSRCSNRSPGTPPKRVSQAVPPAIRRSGASSPTQRDATATTTRRAASRLPWPGLDALHYFWVSPVRAVRGI